VTILHRSCKAAGSKGLEGSSWKPGAPRISRKKAKKTRENLNFLDAAPQGRFSDRAAQQSYPWLSQTTE